MDLSNIYMTSQSIFIAQYLRSIFCENFTVNLGKFCSESKTEKNCWSRKVGFWRESKARKNEPSGVMHANGHTGQCHYRTFKMVNCFYFSDTGILQHKINKIFFYLATVR